MGIAKLNVHTRATFVRAAVKEIPLTTQILNTIYPYFPKDCICIAGYLDSSDQYWKVNYHWDLLVSKLDQFLAMPTVPETLKACARAVRAVLMRNPPNPLSGYRNDKVVGATKDLSSPEKIQARHTLLKQSKKDFESVLLKAGVIHAATKLHPPAAEKPWWLCVAPVAPPGDSKHGTGYALDISGNNVETTRISKDLGATLVFNEASHVHVEWKNGVKAPL
ncbi:MAG: hypothetical protein U1G07_16835 [Verrucomicrobiota bacterium]